MHAGMSEEMVCAQLQQVVLDFRVPCWWLAWFGLDSRDVILVLFRHAHDDPRLIEATRLSRTTFDEWSRQLNVEMVSEDGAVAIGPSVESRLARLRGAGVPVREIDASELAERVPLLASYDGPAMLDERGGAIRTTATVGALAAALGERIVADEVLAIHPVGGEVQVRSGGRTDRYERVVVCAGRGTDRLARSVGISLPVHEGAHVRLTFAVRDDPPPRLATLQDSSGVFGEVGVYAAPTPGNARYSVGLSANTRAREDGSLLAPHELAGHVKRVSDYVRRALPGLDPEPVDVRHCWVTQLPWSEDGLAVWEHQGVLFLVGNNLFKQAPALGRKLAAAADEGDLPDELRPESRLGAP
jgi:sarcosine oxidase